MTSIFRRRQGPGLVVPRFASGHSLAVAVISFLGIGALLDLMILLLFLDHAFASLEGPVRVQMLVYVITGVLFLVWIHRVYRNLLAFGAPGLGSSPGWAVGGFFVPLLNLVYPYRVVADLWAHSDAGGSPRHSWPATSRGASASLVGWWWTLFLISIFVGTFAGRAAGLIAERFDVATAVTVIALGQVFRIAAALLAILVVLGIDRMQERRARREALANAPAGDIASAVTAELRARADPLLRFLWRSAAAQTAGGDVAETARVHEDLVTRYGRPPTGSVLARLMGTPVADDEYLIATDGPSGSLALTNRRLAFMDPASGSYREFAIHDIESAQPDPGLRGITLALRMKNSEVVRLAHLAQSSLPVVVELPLLVERHRPQGQKATTSGP